MNTRVQDQDLDYADDQDDQEQKIAEMQDMIDHLKHRLEVAARTEQMLLAELADARLVSRSSGAVAELWKLFKENPLLNRKALLELAEARGFKHNTASTQITAYFNSKRYSV